MKFKSLIRQNPVGNLPKYEVYDKQFDLFGTSNTSTELAIQSLKIKIQRCKELITQIQQITEDDDGEVVYSACKYVKDNQ